MLNGLAPIHPGELLREDVLPALGLPKSEVAKRLGISRQTLYDILAERQPVTARMALRLGKFCGNGPDLWLTLQCKFDLHRQATAMAGDLERIEPAGAA
jgi:addiction module HigA family antidote